MKIKHVFFLLYFPPFPDVLPFVWNAVNNRPDMCFYELVLSDSANDEFVSPDSVVSVTLCANILITRRGIQNYRGQDSRYVSGLVFPYRKCSKVWVVRWGRKGKKSKKVLFLSLRWMTVRVTIRKLNMTWRLTYKNGRLKETYWNLFTFTVWNTRFKIVD